ncbi:MAG: hypothetical protein IKR81_09650 [Victivallales bacterium]|nr:hypothetical protein [Victivallales bacterium]
MSTISTVEFNLATYSIYNKATQAFEDATVTGNVYTVAGVTDSTGGLRKLSVSELVMVVGLARAAEKEAAIIELMKEMENTTDILNSLTDIEKKLLAGTSLGNITGIYTYQGHEYSAEEFLAIVIGGATPVVPQVDSMLNMLNTLCEQLSDNHIVDAEGPYMYDGQTYMEAYEVISAMGVSTLSSLDLNTFYNVCQNADSYEDGYVLSDSDREQLSLYCNIYLESGATKEDLIQAIDDKYKLDIMNDILDKTGGIIGMPPSGYVQNPSSYLPSSTDQLIKDIESKMDSLNSFSQQKMIELQSETNKRDQAYDMITNILKSLNTVQVGIVNNM